MALTLGNPKKSPEPVPGCALSQSVPITAELDLHRSHRTCAIPKRDEIEIEKFLEIGFQFSQLQRKQ